MFKVAIRTISRRRSATTLTFRRVLRLIIVMVLVLTCVAIVSLAILVFAIVHQARVDERAPADVILVLGTAQWNGRPSPDLQARLDHAYDLYHDGYAPMILLTGGTGRGDIYSESEVSKSYLEQRGVPTSAMRTVGGLTTWQNLQEARASDLRDNERVLLVSDPFTCFASSTWPRTSVWSR
jgi:vancomycin permeability regulator SanA